jgi:hypothetical protein
VDKWAKLKKLSQPERLLLCKTCMLLPMIALGLRMFGFNKMQAFLIRSTYKKNCDLTGEAALFRALSTARIVEIAARHGLYKASCLPKSLTLWRLLRRRDIDSDLRIGVRKEAGVFEAHAWVEICGQPLNDGSDVHKRFAAFEHSVAELGAALR